MAMLIRTKPVVRQEVMFIGLMGVIQTRVLIRSGRNTMGTLRSWSKRRDKWRGSKTCACSIIDTTKKTRQMVFSRWRVFCAHHFAFAVWRTIDINQCYVLIGPRLTSHVSPYWVHKQAFELNVSVYVRLIPNIAAVLTSQFSALIQSLVTFWKNSYIMTDFNQQATDVLIGLSSLALFYSK